MLLLLAGPLAAFELNVAPLMHLQVDEDGYRGSLLGPLVEFSDEHHAVRPLYYHDSERTEVLFPLGSFTEERSRFFPIYSSRDRGEHDSWEFFPFFYGDTGEKKYAGFFPFYGAMYDRYGFDEARFVLWPLYSSTTRDGVTKTSLLWPIFQYAPGQEFKIFPIYGRKVEEDRVRQYFLWPLIHHERGSREDVDAFLPFYRYSRGPDHKSISLLWPFFTYSRNYEAEHTMFSFLWPLGKYASGAYEERTFWPIFSYKNEHLKYKRLTILWPIYKEQHFFDDGLYTKKTSILVLSGSKRQVNAKGEVFSSLSIWPFWYSQHKDGVFSWQFPYLIPSQHAGYQRNWAPLLTLASGSHSEAQTDVNLLWKTFYYQRDSQRERTALSFIFSHEQGDGYRQTGFLSDLIKIRIDNPAAVKKIALSTNQ